MRKFLTVCLCIVVLTSGGLAGEPPAPVPPKIAAESAILVDAVTGKVLYEKHCRVRRPSASTTKVMTAILAIENGDLSEQVSASKYACSTPYGSLHLRPGERMSLNDLLYATMLRSANDGAVCIAEAVAGSEKQFVEMMNAKAKEIGAKDTNFVNPHGLHHASHYSTAYDLALIARYAVGSPVFNDIVRRKTVHVIRSMNDKDVYIKNTARFLWRFDGADGIKTGYTKQAGRCFVGSATRNDWRLITVVLKGQDAGANTAALLDYGFRSFKQVRFARATEVVRTVRVSGGRKSEISVLASTNLVRIVRSSSPAQMKVEVDIPDLRAPITKGDKVGTLTGYLNGEIVGSTALVASESVDSTLAATIGVWTGRFLSACLLALVGYVSYGTAIAKAARRRRRELQA